jgi:hypothetical protein
MLSKVFLNYCVVSNEFDGFRTKTNKYEIRFLYEFRFSYEIRFLHEIRNSYEFRRFELRSTTDLVPKRIS